VAYSGVMLGTRAGRSGSSPGSTASYRDSPGGGENAAVPEMWQGVGGRPDVLRAVRCSPGGSRGPAPATGTGSAGQFRESHVSGGSSPTPYPIGSRISAGTSFPGTRAHRPGRPNAPSCSAGTISRHLHSPTSPRTGPASTARARLPSPAPWGCHGSSPGRAIEVRAENQPARRNDRAPTGRGEPRCGSRTHHRRADTAG